MAYRFPPTSFASSLPHCSRISSPSTPFHLLLRPATAQISSLAFPSKTVCQCDSSDSGLIIDLRNASNSVKDCGVDELKASLFQALQGLNRGIFGVPSKTAIKIHSLIELIESHNPLPKPTASLEKVAGDWRLKYSTISILGSKRTKLGLRDFVTLGDFIQTIDIGQDKATNIVSFSVAALGRLTGALIVEATYKVTTSTRVDIRLENSSINPKQLQSLFRENYDMLLDIFNPEGWLEITYVDDSIRIGRDDKGNIFVLEKVSQSSA